MMLRVMFGMRIFRMGMCRSGSPYIKSSTLTASLRCFNTNLCSADVMFLHLALTAIVECFCLGLELRFCAMIF